MSQESDSVSDLFGEQLKDAQPAVAPFKDGVYRIRGMSMRKGVYKRGKWTGKPFARFVFELTDQPGSRQVSQVLPWFPGKAFFEINFQRLCGMKLSEFTAQCRQEGLEDASAQSKFFLSLFKGVEFEAEIRQRDEWLNVWELKKRLGKPDEQSHQAMAMISDQQQAEELIEKDEIERAGLALERSLEDKAVQLAGQLGLDREQLDALSREEFGNHFSDLGETDQHTLIDLLEERLRNR